MIDRRKWVTRHHPVLHGPNPASPLSVGNGRLAFTADVTGLQTLCGSYAAVTPLCTLADWGWHTTPAPGAEGRYTLEDVRMEDFDFCGRTVRYARTRYPGNEAVYDWLRQNPHKASLVRAGLRLHGEALTAEDFADVRQELQLFTGTLDSRWQLRGAPGHVTTACDPSEDVLAFRIESPLLQSGLTVELDFPYGSPDISGADWNAPEKHRTTMTGASVHREMDDLRYTLRIDAPNAHITQIAPHRIRITSAGTTQDICLSLGQGGALPPASAPETFRRSEEGWAQFWQRGGAVDFSAATDPRGMELERRIVLSLYLLAVNSAGAMPPAETGLTCNSWYGKAHLEMHFWHMAWAPLWGHGELLERSLPWYHAHLPEARENAARNGYRGARWPKMVGPEAMDSPSPIATLLVWQQPHILTLLTLLLRTKMAADIPAFLRTHWPLIRETADFMADYAVLGADGRYHLEPPLIPVQERFAPETVRDPSFEVAYWRFGLSLACDWAEQMGEQPEHQWCAVRDGMAHPPIRGGLYAAHAACADPFGSQTDDHPSMLQCLGMLPGEDIDRAAMARTLEAVEERWDMSSLWGWDFAVMAMTALSLGAPGHAVDLLLSPAEKNSYEVSGHNRQSDRADLPLYLPGNGSLLLAVACMAAGDGPGFHAEEGWQVRTEGLTPYLLPDGLRDDTIQQKEQDRS